MRQTKKSKFKGALGEVGRGGGASGFTRLKAFNQSFKVLVKVLIINIYRTLPVSKLTESAHAKFYITHKLSVVFHINTSHLICSAKQQLVFV